MNAKSLTYGLLAISMSSLFIGCSSLGSEKYPESTKHTVISAIELPKDDSEEMRLYTRCVLMAYILKEQFREAYQWQIPENYGLFARMAAESERDRIFEEVLYSRWSNFYLNKLEKAVDTLVQKNEFEKAREVIWRIPITECKPVNLLLRSGRARLLNEKVNVKQWNIIEKDLTSKTTAFIKSHDYQKAYEFLDNYPRIRTYTALFDEQIDVICKALVTLGIPEEKLKPMKAEASALITQAFVDATEAYDTVSTKQKADAPDLSKYRESLNKLYDLLIKYDCDEAKAEKVIQSIEANIAPLIKEYCLADETTTTTSTLEKLGTTQVNEKIGALINTLTETVRTAQFEKARADYETTMKAKNYAKARELIGLLKRGDMLAKLLVEEVYHHVENQAWEKARNCIRDYVDLGHDKIDASLFVIRIGLLNSVVNPSQQDALLKEMQATYLEKIENGELLETREWLLTYPLVTDIYPDIDASINDAVKAILDLGAHKEETEAGMNEARAHIQALLDKRTGAYNKSYTLDFTALDKALIALEESLIDQSNDKEDAAQRIASIRLFAKEIADKAHQMPTITTQEMNAALAHQRDQLLKDVDLRITKAAAEMAEKERREAYQRLLAALDKEVGIETQISIAEDAIARGLPTISFGLHAVLGDYARAFRLIRNKVELTPEQKSSVLVGAAYLNQPVVLKWAHDLGADIDTPAPRDPLARPALLVAIQTGNIEVVRTVAEKNATMHVADINGDTTLHYAVREGDANMISLALQGTDVNTLNKHGVPAIFTAAARNQVDRVVQLIEAGADLTLAPNGNNALDVACAAGARDVLDPLAEGGAPVTDNALRLAAHNDRLAVAQWLVTKGLDVNAPGIMEEAFAKGNGTSPTYQYLISQGGRPQTINAVLEALYFPRQYENLKNADAEETDEEVKDPLARKAEAEARKAEAEARKAEAEAKRAEAALE